MDLSILRLVTPEHSGHVICLQLPFCPRSRSTYRSSKSEMMHEAWPFVLAFVSLVGRWKWHDGGRVSAQAASCTEFLKPES